jgi:hypothetical protein
MVRHTNPAVTKEAVFVLSRISQWSAKGALALLEANAEVLALSLLKSDDPDVLEWICRMLANISRHTDGQMFSTSITDLETCFSLLISLVE